MLFFVHGMALPPMKRKQRGTSVQALSVIDDNIFVASWDVLSATCKAHRIPCYGPKSNLLERLVAGWVEPPPPAQNCYALRLIRSLTDREFPVGPRAAGRDSSSLEPGGSDAQPLGAQSVGVPLSADSRADAAHLASLMLALEEKIRDCQSSSAWLCRVLDWVSEKIGACVIGGGA